MNPYKILKISEDATPDEIRKAYRKAATKHHPDQGGDVRVFQQVQQAYESLINPKPKKAKKNEADKKREPSKSNQQVRPKQQHKEQSNSSAQTSRWTKNQQSYWAKSRVDSDIENEAGGNDTKQEHASTSMLFTGGRALIFSLIGAPLIGILAFVLFSTNFLSNDHDSEDSFPPHLVRTDQAAKPSVAPSKTAAARSAVTENPSRSVWKVNRSAITFEKTPGRSWIEKNSGTPRFYFQETARNDQFIEIADQSRGYTIRLRNDKAEIKEKSTGFRRLYTGSWHSPDPNKTEDLPEQVLANNGKQQIDWVDGLPKAKELSVAMEKPVLLCVYGTRRGYSPKESQLESLIEPIRDEFSEPFIWVKMDLHNLSRSIRKKLNVGVPEFLILGSNDENIHRFRITSWSKKTLPEELKCGLEKYSIYKKGGNWLPTQQPIPNWKDEVLLNVMPAPLNGFVGGLALTKNDIFILQSNSEQNRGPFYLFKLDRESGRQRFKIRVGNRGSDICADNRFVYVSDSIFSRPIEIYEQSSGKFVRKLHVKTEIPNGRTTTEYRPNNLFQMAFRKKQLWFVGKGGQDFSYAYKTDVQTGVISDRTKRLAAGIHGGLDFDGEQFALGTKNGISFFIQDGTKVGEVKSPFAIGNVAVDGDEILAAYRPEFIYNKVHRRVRSRPAKVEIFKLRRK